MRLWSIPTFKSEKIYYMAGIIDGEGSFNIKRISPTKANKLKNPRYYISVAISMKDKKPIQLIGQWFNLPLRKTKQKLWLCECNDRQAYNLINKIVPYLVTKKKEAKLCKEFYEKIREIPFAKKTDRKEIKVKYFHNKAKRMINTKTVCFPHSKYYLDFCEKYFYNIKELRK